MNKKPYAWLDGIPDNTSDLYNDAGFLNEAEVDEKVEDGFDLDNATDGQILSCAVVGNVKNIDWIDAPSGGFQYSTDEFETGNKWLNGETIYGKTYAVTSSVGTSDYSTLGVMPSGLNHFIDIKATDSISKQTISVEAYVGSGNYMKVKCIGSRTYTGDASNPLYITIFYVK